LKTAVRDIQRKEHVETGPEAAVAVSCSPGDDKEDTASAHDSCCCAETSSNLNLQRSDSADRHESSSLPSMRRIEGRIPESRQSPHIKPRVEVCSCFASVPQRLVARYFGMAFDALKHRDVAQINRMFERLVSLVTGLALAIAEATKIDRMLKRAQLH